MSSFYANFDANKKKFGFNNKTIGAAIEMKPDTLRMAIKNKSLSKLEIAALRKLFKEKPQQPIDNSFIDGLFDNEYFKEKLSNYIKKS